MDNIDLKVKRTVVVGASTNPSRYAYLAAEMLTQGGYEMIPVGIKKGEVFGKKIQDIRSRPRIDGVHTITLYIGPDHQPEWYEYLLSLKPKRIIFNPGTENDTFMKMVADAGIEVAVACTLVMLRTKQY
ncbi:MAG TPA: CoA-binding protein [Cyclobacteriaceae bacterium]|nr:CoA-binding protein [Cyclobacteriaceae bacterium]